MSLAFLVMAITLCSAFICFTVSKEKGLNSTFWLWMAIVFGPLAVPFIYLSKSKEKD
jgi:hypothetical protein|tara:strand:+ start:6292 stop:6462 length:171 start_codon:yes stop_codon:yes gene_type:complete